MIEKNITKYVCEICGAEYSSSNVAISCESKPISKDKGVNIGDKVLIIKGDGFGKKGLVKNVNVFSKEWGHYNWERYWHTIGLLVDVVGSFGSRLLTFDDYEAINEKTNN